MSSLPSLRSLFPEYYLSSSSSPVSSTSSSPSSAPSPLTPPILAPYPLSPPPPSSPPSKPYRPSLASFKFDPSSVKPPPLTEGPVRPSIQTFKYDYNTVLDDDEEESEEYSNGESPTSPVGRLPGEGGAWSHASRKHTCSICHKRFSRPSSLRIHEHTHTGSKPFPCTWPRCGRTFNVASNMRRHYRSHLSDGDSSGRAVPLPTSPRSSNERVPTHAEVLAATQRRVTVFSAHEPVSQQMMMKNVPLPPPPSARSSYNREPSYRLRPVTF